VPDSKTSKRKRKVKVVEPEVVQDVTPEEEADSKSKRRKQNNNSRILNNLMRKKANPDLYVKTNRGRYVSKKKSELGKKNPQSLAIRGARDILGMGGKMVIINRGNDGKALHQLTGKIREHIKGGGSMESARADKIICEFIEKCKKLCAGEGDCAEEE